ncbi:uncharacterized protein RAG0_13652 [Rhynchosporium agropyri]|uniref:C2H2-type domain-containing protein n=1 Tax=Rhynchosporium agropyri TaxID=914238 RepID=A0A1E1LDZ2_9HELO|nr:uncharacterized protein RAG0_13652 [Rhynchosporium agropyri]
MASRCVPCDRDFGSQQALQQHLNSPAHAFDCEDCDKRFGSEQALQQHLDSPVHVVISEYSGIPRSIVESVYAVAKRLRFKPPTVGDVLRNSKFVLEDGIVAALISAAQRLLPVDNTEEGIAIRTQRHLEAKRTEENFCTQLLRSGHIFLRENQQLGKAVTPDVLFQESTLICGHLCFWLEYKDSFGFRSNPFVAASTKRQLLKYATQIGPGAVVYKQGYETGHLSIHEVTSFREKEVLEYVRRKPALPATQSRTMIFSPRLNKDLS